MLKPSHVNIRTCQEHSYPLRAGNRTLQHLTGDNDAMYFLTMMTAQEAAAVNAATAPRITKIVFTAPLPSSGIDPFGKFGSLLLHFTGDPGS